MDGTYKIHQDAGDAARARKKSIKLMVIFFAVIMLFSFGKTLLEIYTDWMWFTHDAQQPEVFTKTLNTKVMLWVAGMVTTFFIIYLNARKALSSESVFESAPTDENSKAAANLLGGIQKFARLLSVAAALFVGFGVAGTLSSAYRELWAFTAAVPFNKLDPLFGLDLGFFVFKLPWYMTVANTAVSILVVTLVVTVAGYFGSKGLAKVAKVELAQTSMRLHISIVGGLAIAAFGARMFLSRYMMGVQQGEQFTGPGYSQDKVIVFYGVMGALTMFVGLLTMINAKLWKPWKVPTYGVPFLFVLGLVLFGIVPGIYQKTFVEGNVLTAEKPFAARAIESTRFAYGLDNFEVRPDFEITDAPTAQEVSDSQGTLKTMRLWDPSVLKNVFGEKQAIAPYYDFNDVDIDRYTIDGEQRLVMIGARDVNFNGLAESSRNWPNQHLVYTHGFGLVAVPADESVNGLPNYWQSNFPPNQGTTFDVKEQRLYFSQYPVGSVERSDYVLLKSKQEELDYPSDGAVKHMHTWTGSRGVPINGAMARFAYSTLHGNIKLYTTKDISDETRMVYHRDILDRARLIYPFLQFDTDPYVVLEEGRVFWFIDAYTVSDQIPYSEFTGSSFNYIRNSVKIIIDAYDGTMNAYAIDEDEPILKTWMGVFPGLIRPNSEVPDGIRAHFRYAEGLFRAQAEILTTYHVTDPIKFLNNEDAWQIPQEIGRGGSKEPITPYYVQMRLPEADEDGFMLILPFSPRTKNNMIGWMAAHCDPDDYGKVVLYRFPRDTQTQGPLQMESKFSADPVIADINRQFNNDQSSIVPGNLLVVPIGSSLLYVKPLFLQSKARAIPELRKVILGLQNKVVVADTYEEALEMLFGDVSTVQPDPIVSDNLATPDPDEPEVATTGQTPDIAKEVAEALRLLDQADAALRNGEFARYGELQKQAREKLKGLSD